MKPRIVSAIGMLFCCGILAFVVVFGYSRYKAGEAENAAFLQRQNQLFHSQVQAGAPAPPGAIAARMPDQLPPRASNASEGLPTPSPGP